MGLGEPRNLGFVVPCVRVAPEADVRMGERLRGIVCRDANDVDAFGQRPGQQFTQDVVAAHEAAEDDDTRAVLPFWSGDEGAGFQWLRRTRSFWDRAHGMS